MTVEKKIGRAWCVLIKYNCAFSRGHGKDGRPDCKLLEYKKAIGSKHTQCPNLDQVPLKLRIYLPDSVTSDMEPQGSLL